MNQNRFLYKLSLLFLFSLFIGICHVDTIHAQAGLNAQDLSQVRADDVSDAQLRTFLNRAEEEGISVDQAFQMARQRGLRSSEAQILRQRIRELDRRAESRDEVELRRIDEDERFRDDFIRPPRFETERMRRTFGSQIFREQATEFTPSRNMPTPVNYILGPGDELVINIWGDQTNTYRLPVSSEGTIDIENLGPVYVNGLTMQEANERIIQSLQQIYTGLRPDRDERTTFARVSIDRLRSIQVAMIGEVTNPGDYAIPSNATVFNALYRAGGPAENGSYRNIRVIRENQIIAELDLYDFLVDGEQSNNIRLRDGDVIQIPPFLSRVEVEGELKRDGLFFEVKEDETLSDLIRFAGGFTDRAYTRQVRVHRNTPTERRVENISMDLLDETPVFSGDVVFVDEILDRFENRVSISGAVWRSGEFALAEGMTLGDLIREADGIRPDAFQTRGIINRIRDDYTFEQISFDVSEVMNNPGQNDILLRREDHVRIRSIHNMADEQEVQIRGAVRSGGSFHYRDRMTLEDLILKADGFLNSASEARIEISRRIIGEASPEQRGQQLAEIFTFDVPRNLQLRDEDAMFFLQPFDQVYVHRRPDYREQQTITIEGEVLYPGTYTIQDRNERISDIIQRAGGLTREAYLPGARLVRQLSSIDRPEVDLGFLTQEDVLNEEALGFGRAQEIERREREDERRTNGRFPDDERRERDRERDEDAERTIEEQRIESNRRDSLEQQEEEVRMTDEERRAAERRIGIDLASILQQPGTEEDLYLRDGDVIRIPQELQTVAIAGAVMQDVEVRYREGMSLGYYIDRAGGYAENARSGRAYVVYANGDVDRRKRYVFGLIKSSPDIEPGAQIIIPAKPPRERMNVGEVISISAAIVGMSTSLLIAIDRISR